MPGRLIPNSSAHLADTLKSIVVLHFPFELLNHFIYSDIFFSENAAVVVVVEAPAPKGLPGGDPCDHQHRFRAEEKNFDCCGWHM